MSAADLEHRLAEVGLTRKSGLEHFVGTVVFPLYDPEGQIVGVYGRRISRDQPRHLYLPGPHRGIFNLEALRSLADDFPETEAKACREAIDTLTRTMAAEQDPQRLAARLAETFLQHFRDACKARKPLFRKIRDSCRCPEQCSQGLVTGGSGNCEQVCVVQSAPWRAQQAEPCNAVGRVQQRACQSREVAHDLVVSKTLDIDGLVRDPGLAQCGHDLRKMALCAGEDRDFLKRMVGKRLTDKFANCRSFRITVVIERGVKVDSV